MDYAATARRDVIDRFVDGVAVDGFAIAHSTRLAYVEPRSR
jgi:hypothetical protein